MFSCVSLPNIHRNISAVVDFTTASHSLGVSGDRGYFECLQALQGHPYRFHSEKEAYLLDLDPGRDWMQRILGKDAESDPRDSGTAPPAPALATANGPDRETIARNVAAAIRILGDFEPDIPEIVRLLVGCILCVSRQGYTGGSFTDLLGVIVIWISPQEDWGPAEYAEQILHESVHQATFLDDMVNRLFEATPSRMAQEDALITSSLRKTRRPYDTAFHTVCVSVTLAGFYEHLGMTDRAFEFLGPVPATLAELRVRADLLTGHGRSLLEEVSASVSLAANAIS